MDDLLRIIGLLSVLYIIFAGIRYILSQGSPDKTAEALHTIQYAILGLGISLIAIWFVSFVGNQFSSTYGGITPAGLDLSYLPNPTGIDNGSIVQTFLHIAFNVIGALSFLFVVIGGYQYVQSQGDPQKVSKAKDTIMYALIGLAVAIVAQSIVSLVVKKV